MAQTELLEADLFTGKVPFPSVFAPGAPRQNPSKTGEAFKTISETAGMLALPAHVLRFWESQFRQLRPLKLKGGRRYYRPHDIHTLLTIKQLLYAQGYTIKGARKALAGSLKERKSGEDMPKEKKPRIAPLHETPLFSALAEAGPETISPARRRQIAAIRAELLELKEMLNHLPELQH